MVRWVRTSTSFVEREGKEGKPGRDTWEKLGEKLDFSMNLFDERTCSRHLRDLGSVRVMSSTLEN